MDRRHHQLILSACFAISVLGLHPRAAMACDFETVMQGNCPGEDVISDAPATEDTGEEFGVLSAKHNWANFKDFKQLKTSEPIVLKSCFYQTSTLLRNLTKTSGSKSVDLSHKALQRLAKSVINLVSVWETAEDTSFTPSIKSRIRFDFGDHKSPNLCETNSDTHVRVAFNNLGVNSALRGTGGIKNKPIYWGDRPTVTLSLRKVGLGNRILRSSAVVHEFGHVLGFHHEMAHKGWIPCANAFDSAAWVATTSGYGKGLSKEENEKIAASRFDRYKKRIKGVKSPRPFDPSSVMGYAIKSRFFVDEQGKTMRGCGMTGARTKLSDTDIAVFLGTYGG